MKTRILFLLIVFNVFSYAQEKLILNEINNQIWQPFTKAFETCDYELFANIHSKDLIRISGNQKHIKSFTNYLDGYKKGWQNKEIKQTISFRFLERIFNDTLASERGIYKLTVDLGTENEKSYYGKFHVLIKQNNGTWQLIMDYDSSENNTINKSTYNAAFAIDDFEKY